MKDMATHFWNGFCGSFVLAWAIILIVALGNGRNLLRMLDQFVNHEPLEVAPGRLIRVPGADGR